MQEKFAQYVMFKGPILLYNEKRYVPQFQKRKGCCMMKKLVTLFFALLLCVSVLAASLQAAGYASATDPDLTVTIAPRDTDGLNTVPAEQDGERRD